MGSRLAQSLGQPAAPGGIVAVAGGMHLAAAEALLPGGGGGASLDRKSGKH